MVADTVNLNSVDAASAVEPHTITLTDGDIFNVGAAGGSLDTFPQTITATAAAASTAIVNIDDSGDTTSNTYFYHGSNVTRVLPLGTFSLNYSNVTAPSLKAGTGNDTFNITGALGGGTATFDGGGGDDTFAVSPIAGTLDGFGAAFSFVGGAGTNDVLNLNDSLDPDPNTYTIFNAALNRARLCHRQLQFDDRDGKPARRHEHQPVQPERYRPLHEAEHHGERRLRSSRVRERRLAQWRHLRRRRRRC